MTRDQLAGTLDIAQTILDLTGVRPYNGMQGISLLPTIASSTASGVRLPGARATAEVITARERLSVYAGADWGNFTISSTIRLRSTTAGTIACAEPSCWS